jgi:hypothetical protein
LTKHAALWRRAVSTALPSWEKRQGTGSGACLHLSGG